MCRGPLWPQAGQIIRPVTAPSSLTSLFLLTLPHRKHLCTTTNGLLWPSFIMNLPKGCRGPASSIAGSPSDLAQCASRRRGDHVRLEGCLGNALAEGRRTLIGLTSSACDLCPSPFYLTQMLSQRRRNDALVRPNRKEVRRKHGRQELGAFATVAG